MPKEGGEKVSGRGCETRVWHGGEGQGNGDRRCMSGWRKGKEEDGAVGGVGGVGVSGEKDGGARNSGKGRGGVGDGGGEMREGGIGDEGGGGVKKK